MSQHKMLCHIMGFYVTTITASLHSTVANYVYVVLLVTLYFAGVAMLNKVDSKHAASN